VNLADPGDPGDPECLVDLEFPVDPEHLECLDPEYLVVPECPVNPEHLESPFRLANLAALERLGCLSLVFLGSKDPVCLEDPAHLVDPERLGY
jgi:hypothetical protein